LERHLVQCEARRLRSRAVAGRRGRIAERDMLELDPAEWRRGLQRARCGGRSERREGLPVLEEEAGLVELRHVPDEARKLSRELLRGGDRCTGLSNADPPLDDEVRERAV